MGEASGPAAMLTAAASTSLHGDEVTRSPRCDLSQESRDDKGFHGSPDAPDVLRPLSKCNTFS